MPTQLSYSISTDPSTVTVNDTDVTLTVMATNKTSGPVAISYIVVKFPVGDEAGDLTDDVTSMTCTGPDDTWTGSITPFPGTNQYYCQFKAPTGYTLQQLQSVSFSLGGIAIIGDPSSNVKITIAENSPSSTETLNIQIYPAGWAQLSFTASETNIDAGNSVVLSWSGGPVDAEYTLSYMYNNAQVVEPATGTYLNVDSFTTPALTIDTTFTLNVKKEQMCFQAFVPITVALPLPEMLSFTGTCGDSNLLMVNWTAKLSRATDYVWVNFQPDSHNFPNPSLPVNPENIKYYDLLKQYDLFVTACNTTDPPVTFVAGQSLRLYRAFQTQFYISDLVNKSANPGAGKVMAIIQNSVSEVYLFYDNGYAVTYNPTKGSVTACVNLELDSSIVLTRARKIDNTIYFDNIQNNSSQTYHPVISFANGSLSYPDPKPYIKNGAQQNVRGRAYTFVLTIPSDGGIMRPNPWWICYSDNDMCFYTLNGGYDILNHKRILNDTLNVYSVDADSTLSDSMAIVNVGNSFQYIGFGELSEWARIESGYLAPNNSAQGTTVVGINNLFVLNTDNYRVGWTDLGSYNEIAPVRSGDNFYQIACDSERKLLFALTADTVQLIDPKDPSGVLASIPILQTQPSPFVIDENCQMYILANPSGADVIYTIILANGNSLLQLQFCFVSSAS